jgi:hypothetical protein
MTDMLFKKIHKPAGKLGVLALLLRSVGYTDLYYQEL